MKFQSKPVEEHGEVPLADEGRWEAVMNTWTKEEGETTCYVVSVGDWRSESHQRAQLAEILGLVEAHGDTVVGFESLRQKRLEPRTFLGTGTCNEVADRAREHGATLLVVDAQLSPSQTRNLEDATGLSVSDREIVILGVFQKHARSRTARIQIEIAHLQYLRPRIRGLGLNMDQQAGGVMNGKGAGETASELMARQLDDRLVVLQRAAKKLLKSSALQRQSRQDCARIALVGYTNAGKTSLMNALAGTALSTRSRPFETLDTTSRCLTRHGGDVLIGDTVGFIRDLPDRLLASFASTLAEVAEASLLVVVSDLSDSEWRLHLATTHDQLVKLGAERVRRFYVFNKADQCTGPVPVDALKLETEGHPFRVVSSFDVDAMRALRSSLIEQARSDTHCTATVCIPYAETERTAQVYRSCRVLHSEALAEVLQLQIEGPRFVVKQIAGAKI